MDGETPDMCLVIQYNNYYIIRPGKLSISDDKQSQYYPVSMVFNIYY